MCKCYRDGTTVNKHAYVYFSALFTQRFVHDVYKCAIDISENVWFKIKVWTIIRHWTLICSFSPAYDEATNVTHTQRTFNFITLRHKKQFTFCKHHFSAIVFGSFKKYFKQFISKKPNGIDSTLVSKTSCNRQDLSSHCLNPWWIELTDVDFF